MLRLPVMLDSSFRNFFSNISRIAPACW